MPSSLHPGDRVRLVVPENPRLHGHLATVEQLTAWGAHVLTAAAATRRFRALWAEMQPEGEALANAHAVSQATSDFAKAVLPRAQARPRVREWGYTGDVCPTCGGSRLRRSGSCAVCEECGSTSGCS